MPLTAKEAIRMLEDAGFVFDRQSGAHKIYRHPDGRRCTVADHRGDMKPGTLANMRRESKLPFRK